MSDAEKRMDSDRTSERLARSLDASGLCVKDGVLPLTGEMARQGADLGMTGAWVCVGPNPTDGGHGGTQTITWVAASPADKDKALQRALASYTEACSGPGGIGGGASSDGESTPPPSVPAEVTARYVEGTDWLAFVGVNANLRAVATALGGEPVSRHCGG